MKTIFSIFVCIAVLVTGSMAEERSKPFAHKVIFSETPDIGEKWHGGIRMNDFLIWEGYWNINNWLMADLVAAGLPNLLRAQGGTMTDNFRIFTLKSRPFSAQVKGHPYTAGVGLKTYSSKSQFGDSTMLLMDSEDKSTALFITQGYQWNRHSFNLFTSISSHQNQDQSTFFIIPAYSVAINERWSFSFEYYMTNTRFIPMKSSQFAKDSDKLDFDNRDRDLYSFIFFGFQYKRTHLRIDLSLASHYTFQYVKLPLLGLGWAF